MSPPSTPTPAPPGGPGLRLRIQLLLATLMSLFVLALLALQIDGTRRSVQEEIVAGNRVAGQLLERVSWVYRRGGSETLLDFLVALGRVRANEITLVDAAGRELYRSPPSTYKAGRAAPDWYARLVMPPVQRQVIRLPSGELAVEADPSRAILDGWDELLRLGGLAAAALLLLNLVVFWFVGRTLRPFSTILRGLARLEGGDYAARLPALPGKEAASIGLAVNRMAAAVEDQLQARLQAYEAERSLAESRELARQIELHTERERRDMARELHDELGQSVIAIRSLAQSLSHRLAPGAAQADATGHQAAGLISSEAARLYDAMHNLLPRLTPLALDTLGLGDALADLVQGAQQRAAEPLITLTLGDPPAELSADLPAERALAAYRVVQEALNNALRHAAATQIRIELALQAGASGRQLSICVIDDGRGLPADWQRAGHYGLRGLRERVRSLGGEMTVLNRGVPGEAEHGVVVAATLPLPPATPDAVSTALAPSTLPAEEPRP
jgi:two-component system, NarL family, sensor histidine kinase UhpB